MTSRTYPVFVIDDDAAMRDALQTLMQTSGLDCQCFDSAEAFLEYYDPVMAGCLVLDVRMPGMSGVQLQQHLIDKQITLPIVVISGHADVSMAVTMMRKGAIDFFEKPFKNERLVARVKDCLQRQADQFADYDEIRQVQLHLNTLTKREREVLEGVMDGKPSKMIASELGICDKTVDVHRSRIMEKMRVRSIAKLIREVMRVQERH